MSETGAAGTVGATPPPIPDDALARADAVDARAANAVAKGGRGDGAPPADLPEDVERGGGSDGPRGGDGSDDGATVERDGTDEPATGFEDPRGVAKGGERNGHGGPEAAKRERAAAADAAAGGGLESAFPADETQLVRLAQARDTSGDVVVGDANGAPADGTGDVDASPATIASSETKKHVWRDVPGRLYNYVLKAPGRAYNYVVNTPSRIYNYVRNSWSQASDPTYTIDTRTAVDARYELPGAARGSFLTRFGGWITDPLNTISWTRIKRWAGHKWRTSIFSPGSWIPSAGSQIPQKGSTLSGNTMGLTNWLRRRFGYYLPGDAKTEDAKVGKIGIDYQGTSVDDTLQLQAIANENKKDALNERDKAQRAYDIVKAKHNKALGKLTELESADEPNSAKIATAEARISELDALLAEVRADLDAAERAVEQAQIDAENAHAQTDIAMGSPFTTESEERYWAAIETATWKVVDRLEGPAAEAARQRLALDRQRYKEAKTLSTVDQRRTLRGAAAEGFMFYSELETARMVYRKNLRRTLDTLVPPPLADGSEDTTTLAFVTAQRKKASLAKPEIDDTQWHLVRARMAKAESTLLGYAANGVQVWTDFLIVRTLWDVAFPEGRFKEFNRLYDAGQTAVYFTVNLLIEIVQRPLWREIEQPFEYLYDQAFRVVPERYKSEGWTPTKDWKPKMWHRIADLPENTRKFFAGIRKGLWRSSLRFR